MVRRIVQINEGKCNGCGACAAACHEGAIKMIDGIAKLTRDDYCDGLGDCLPTCPTGAISFVEREALPYDEIAVKEAAKKTNLPCGCPGTQSKAIHRDNAKVQNGNISDTASGACVTLDSQLSQWPVQIKLVPVNAPYFQNANLLVAADCTAYAYGNFHDEFIKNRITVIGCPKLDDQDYAEKLTEIIRNNEIKSVTVVRMEVPCCGGIEQAVKTALQNSGKFLPWNVVTISTDGRILSR